MTVPTSILRPPSPRSRLTPQAHVLMLLNRALHSLNLVPFVFSDKLLKGNTYLRFGVRLQCTFLM